MGFYYHLFMVTFLPCIYGRSMRYAAPVAPVAPRPAVGLRERFTKIK
jgi:hypothetical protein